jgi:hypothetical protein
MRREAHIGAVSRWITLVWSGVGTIGVERKWFSHPSRGLADELPRDEAEPQPPVPAARNAGRPHRRKSCRLVFVFFFLFATRIPTSPTFPQCSVAQCPEMGFLEPAKGQLFWVGDGPGGALFPADLEGLGICRGSKAKLPHNAALFGAGAALRILKTIIICLHLVISNSDESRNSFIRHAGITIVIPLWISSASPSLIGSPSLSVMVFRTSIESQN